MKEESVNEVHCVAGGLVKIILALSVTSMRLHSTGFICPNAADICRRLFCHIKGCQAMACLRIAWSAKSTCFTFQRQTCQTRIDRAYSSCTCGGDGKHARLHRAVTTTPFDNPWYHHCSSIAYPNSQVLILRTIYSLSIIGNVRTPWSDAPSLAPCFSALS